ncbi:MAG: DUF1289 domain-containing protein [Gammaproteobacteria bacterium]|nr:DUF1289 domain-containing protein [Gammaproteobacteria bacterium]MCY4218135.1 DUF1289 domain-containing protein [Gammaproteobacteria bacterium]MCY4275242.1 DUF1289 domain-containing protein [Gammaproteobacteria bacterium]
MSTTTRTRRTNQRRGINSKRVFDNTVPSPCLSVCTFDGQPYCRGCYRNADEIRDWMIMSRQQKLYILTQLDIRRKQDFTQTCFESREE